MENDPREEIVEVLQGIEDPDMMLDIWFIGLIYDIRVDGGLVEIDMTFTTPLCPSGPTLVEQVKNGVESLSWVDTAVVKVVFDPPWEPNEEVKGMMGLL